MTGADMIGKRALKAVPASAKARDEVTIDGMDPARWAAALSPHRAYTSITDGDRETIRRMATEGRTFQEIADAVGRPLGTVSNTISAMRKAGVLPKAAQRGADV